jgi:non-heme chloroperoxidase
VFKNAPFVQVKGQGQPMILLHSWAGSHQDWKRLLPALNEQFQTYAWDAKGHGKSVVSDTDPVTIEHMAHDLHDLIIHHDLYNIVLVGHSMGAFVLWSYLKTYGQDRVSKIAILDQSPKLLTDPTWDKGIYGDFDHQKNQSFLGDLRVDFAETLLRLWANGHNAQTKQAYENNSSFIQMLRSYYQKLDPKPLIEVWESLVQQDFRAFLSEIQCPVLLVYGGKSNYYSVETAQFVKEKIAKSRLKIYENGDHAPHLNEPERFLDDFISFVNS